MVARFRDYKLELQGLQIGAALGISNWGKRFQIAAENTNQGQRDFKSLQGFQIGAEQKFITKCIRSTITKCNALYIMRWHNNLFKATNNMQIFHAFLIGTYEPEESNTLSVKTLSLKSDEFFVRLQKYLLTNN